jgi:hypothetical protein
LRADLAILCALHEHLALLRGISTPLIQYGSCSLVEYEGQLWGLALQGRTSSISYENTRSLFRAFGPAPTYTFGPAALISGKHSTRTWFTTRCCARLTMGSGNQPPEITAALNCAATPLRSIRCQEAELLISAENFIANGRLINALAQCGGHGTALLDMGGHGVSRASAEAGVAWRHFRWTTDRAADTAVSQFSWNVRDLARRGNEVLELLREVTNESCVID